MFNKTCSCHEDYVLQKDFSSLRLVFDRMYAEQDCSSYKKEVLHNTEFNCNYLIRILLNQYIYFLNRFSIKSNIFIAFKYNIFFKHL